MSTSRSTDGSQTRAPTGLQWLEASAVTPRSLALLGLAALTLGYCTTLYWVTTVTGGTAWLAGGIAIGIGAGIVLRDTEEQTVRTVAVAGAAIAGVLYYSSATPSIDVGTVVSGSLDGLAMLSGISVLRLAAVDVWIGALVPIPVFLTTYLGLRRRYELAAIASGWLVLFLAATGDATVLETLLGSVGAVAAVGFGELDRRGGSVRGVDLVVALIAVMAVLAVAVPMVPSGTSGAVDPAGVASDGDAIAGDGAGQSGQTALDEQLLSGDSVTAGGPINLSPDVRMVVTSEERRRYRLDALDRYEGDRWVRTGRNRLLSDLEGPPGESRSVVQRFELRAPAQDVPTASYPVDVRDGPTDDLEATSTGAVTVDGELSAGTTLTVESQVPEASETTLRNAGTDYPAAIERRYTRLTDGTAPQRVYNLTDEVTSRSSNPYETARAIETYLQEHKAYSQNVSAPSGSMADSFLFEMEAGYCTYYAGTMATMLRTQGVPARVAVGYTGGQWVGNDTWVVRGTDAHAWVEVYFPEVGWVEFDPTPANDVENARTDAIESARANGTGAVDVTESEGEQLRFDRPPESPDDGNATNGTDGGGSEDADDGGNGTAVAGGGSTNYPDAYPGISYSLSDDGSSTDYVQPNLTTYAGPAETNETAANETSVGERGDRLLGGFDAAVIALLLVAGTVAGGRRVGVQRRLRHAGNVLWQRRRDPETDVQIAMERLDAVLAERFEPRRDGETRREYRSRLPRDVDLDVHRAFELHERARYDGDVDRATAEELVEIVDGIARERVPVVRRLT